MCSGGSTGLGRAGSRGFDVRPPDVLHTHWNLPTTRYILMPVLRRALRSPAMGLVLGLIITLAAVVTYSAYITHQIAGLRALQNNLVERNRKASLQLLRVQNDLNSLALAMRDMLDNDEPYPLTAWKSQFARIREDLDDALQSEEHLDRRHPHARSKKISSRFPRPILERRRPHLRASAKWPGQRSPRPNPPHPASPPGRSQHRRLAPPRAK